MTTSNAVNCMECDIYLSRYESATFDLVKAANALDLAERLPDREAMSRRRREYQKALEKQVTAQSIFANHQSTHEDSPFVDTEKRVALDRYSTAG